MDTIIIYYSHSGNNNILAEELNKRIKSDIYKISELRKRYKISILFDSLFKRNSKIENTNIEIKKYKKIILVSPIWDCSIATPMKSFLEREKNNLEKYFFITICNGEIGQKEKIMNELTNIVQRKPENVTELWINDLLPKDKQNKIRYTFNFRINRQDFQKFERKICAFIQNVNNCGDVI